MEVFVITTPQGHDTETLKVAFEPVGDVAFIAQYQNENAMRDAFPMTHVNMSQGKALDPIAVKVQHLAAWEQIMHLEIPGGIVVLDTVRLDNEFAKNIELTRPKNSDICIFSPPNLQINGVHLNGTQWVFLDSEDASFNNICNAYYVTLDAAKRLYNRRNEMLNDDVPIGRFINSVSQRLALDRMGTFMTLHPTSSKPTHIKS